MRVQNQKKLVIFSMGIYVCILLLFNLGNSVMPLFLKNTEFGTAIFGYLMGFMFLGQFIVAPLWGSLSDKRGRIILALSPLGYGIGQLFYILSTHSIVLLIASRVFAGIFSILFLSQFVAYISDIAPVEQRQRTLSLTAIMGPLGAGFAYLIGGAIKSDFFATLLSKIRVFLAFLGEDLSDKLTQVYTFPFFLQFILGIFATIFLYSFIKANNQYQIFHKGESIVETNPIKRIFNQFTILLQYKKTIVFSMIAISFFNSLAYSATQSIQYYLQDGLLLDAQGIGVVVFIYNVASVVISFVIQGKLLHQFSKWKNLLIANAVVILLAILLSLANVWQLVVIMSIIIMMNTLLVSIIQGSLVEYAADQRGTLLGLNQSAISLASIIGNFIVSPLYSFKPEILNYRLPFIMMAIILIIVTLIILFPLKKQMIEK